MAASDPQRERVYEIENQFAGMVRSSRATREHLQYLVTDVAKDYGLAPPTLKIVARLPAKWSGRYLNGLIELSREGGGVNPMTCLHELSHWVVDQFYTDAEHHGPEFAAVLSRLLDVYFVIPRSCYRMLAKKYGVRVGCRCTPKALARLRGSQNG